MSMQLISSNQYNSPLLVLNEGQEEMFSYSAYGTTANQQQDCPGFNGERCDPLNGVSHLGNGYRAYSPLLMRFTCPDSLSPFDRGGINSYVYCESDPVNHVDPSGHMILRNMLSSIAGGVREISKLATTGEEAGSISALDAKQSASDAASVADSSSFKSGGQELHAPKDVSEASGMQDRTQTGGENSSSTSPDSGQRQDSPKNQALARRDRVAAAVALNPTPDSIYVPAVSCVNQVLKKVGVGLTEQACAVVIDNLYQVRRGTRTEAAASLRESVVFASDTLNYLKAGSFVDAGITATGILVNTLGSTLYLANYDRERMKPVERAMYDAMSPL